MPSVVSSGYALLQQGSISSSIICTSGRVEVITGCPVERQPTAQRAAVGWLPAGVRTRILLPRILNDALPVFSAP